MAKSTAARFGAPKRGTPLIFRIQLTRMSYVGHLNPVRERDILMPRGTEAIVVSIGIEQIAAKHRRGRLIGLVVDVNVLTGRR